ncbi:OadG family protein [Litorivivens sp.]|uniref:OadG family protein n=1 Tax=Litorivivens sp. TaxID=2020868 RepID=UPI003561E36C
MATSLLAGGLELMVFGMGTVFVFLTVLVLVTATMSRLVQHFSPEQAPPNTPSPEPSPETLAVISAAIHKHRQVQRSSH